MCAASGWNCKHLSTKCSDECPQIEDGINKSSLSGFTLTFVKHGFRLAPEECKKTLLVCFASLAMISAGESLQSRCWSCCACLSTFTSKDKVDMLCNQCHSAWWSIRNKQTNKTKTKTATNQKTSTTTKQVVFDTKWGILNFLVFAFAFSWNVLRFP